MARLCEECRCPAMKQLHFGVGRRLGQGERMAEREMLSAMIVLESKIGSFVVVGAKEKTSLRNVVLCCVVSDPGFWWWM